MELFEVIAKRHSYRGGYTSEAVPREALKQIVEAGLRAPSGKNMQTTEFVIVDDRKLLEKIRALHPKNKAMQEAKAFIACVVDKKAEATYKGFSFQIEDCAAAVENMLLAVTALGFATVWIDGWLRLNDYAEKIGLLLKLPETKQIRVILPIGVPAEEYPQVHRKDFTERAWFNAYKA